MGRASGKHTPREVKPGTPEGDYIGMSDRMSQDQDKSPIPGGNHHITNQPSVRQRVPVADARKEYRGFMEHGVPSDSITTHERADRERGGPNEVHPVAPHFVPVPEKVPPVPVYIVERSSGSKPLTTLAGDKFTVPASTSDPIRIAGRDLTRSQIAFLIETAAGSAGAAPTGVRVDHEVGNLTVGRGFLIPAGTTGYQRFDCQDELFAVSNDGSACTMSVVYMYAVGGAG